MTQKNRQVQLFQGDVEFASASAVTFNGTTTLAGATTISGALTQTGAVNRTGRQSWVPAAVGKIGATAGFATAEDGGLVRVPASQTASTYVVPITGLHLGDTLQAVDVVAQVESAGNIATVALSVRKSTLAAADFVDAELDSAASGNLTADTAISPANTQLGVAALAETLAEGEHLYALLTVTTAAATDVAVAGLIVNYDQV